MGSLLKTYFKSGYAQYQEFKNIEFWLTMLKSENSKAIHYLFHRVTTPVFQICRSINLQDEMAEELVSDSILIFLQKLQNEQYVYEGIDPIHYILEIARRNANNYNRTKIKHKAVELTQSHDVAESPPTLEDLNQEMLNLLKMLGTNCERLIRLKYLEEFKDAQIIEQGLTQYTTIDALKNNRSKCFKKLLQLAQSKRASQL